MDKPWKEQFKEPYAGHAGKGFEAVAHIHYDQTAPSALEAMRLAAEQYEIGKAKFLELAVFPNRETLRHLLFNLADAGSLLGFVLASNGKNESHPTVLQAHTHVRNVVDSILDVFHEQDSHSTSA